MHVLQHQLYLLEQHTDHLKFGQQLLGFTLRVMEMGPGLELIYPYLKQFKKCKVYIYGV